MIKQKDVLASVAAGHTKTAQGTVIDRELVKAAKGVSRNRLYRVYLPAGYNPSRRYPLVMVLHGCSQDHRAIQNIAGFDAIADRVGAIVVYPFVTTYSGLRTQNCWGWWLSAQRQRGRGEVADLKRIAEDVSDEYAVDPSRRHVCGLSAGAAMSVACLTTYSDYWTSGASVAGVPYGESSSSVRANAHVPVRRKTLNTLIRLLSRALVAPAPQLIIVQSSSDKVVGPRLGANLRDSWLKVSNCEKHSLQVDVSVTHGVSWQFDQFGKSGKLHIGYLFIDGIDHGWPGGLEGQFSIPKAPNVSELIWCFFEHVAKT